MIAIGHKVAGATSGQKKRPVMNYPICSIDMVAIGILAAASAFVAT